MEEYDKFDVFEWETGKKDKVYGVRGIERFACDLYLAYHN